MKKLFKLIIKIILIILVVGLITMFIDLNRVNNNKLPVFSINTYNSKTKTQTFQGIIYTFNRKIKSSLNENISDEDYYSFKVLFLKLNTKKFTNNYKDYNIEIVNEEECSDIKILDEQEDSVVYSYCIDKITIANEEITLSKILEMEKDFKYLGYNNVSTIYGIDNMVIYKCNEINDYYITSRNIDINNNLCIKKDSKE